MAMHFLPGKVTLHTVATTGRTGIKPLGDHLQTHTTSMAPGNFFKFMSTKAPNDADVGVVPCRSNDFGLQSTYGDMKKQGH